MALVACASCGGKVSSRADKCPHCGAPSPGSVTEAAGGVREEEVSSHASVLGEVLAMLSVALVVAVLALVAVFHGRLQP